MDNPDDEKTTINVKSVSAAAWERAKSSATKQGETMGAWLSRAINRLADSEAGPREFPPSLANPAPEMVKPDSPSVPVSPVDLATLMQGMASLASATGVPPAKADVRRAYGLADDLVRDARGIPRKPRIVGKARGQSLLESSKAGTLDMKRQE